MNINKLKIFINLNCESENLDFEIKSLSINFDDKIKNIKFFNNFFGEVGYIYMFSQKDPGSSNILTVHFLSEFNKYKEGLSKKKLFNNFLNFLKSIPSIDLKTKSIFFKSNKIDKNQANLYDNLIFFFSPINYYKLNPYIIEDALGNYQLRRCSWQLST